MGNAILRHVSEAQFRCQFRFLTYCVTCLPACRGQAADRRNKEFKMTYHRVSPWVDPDPPPTYYSEGLMTLHFASLRLLLFLGLCAWLSLPLGRSAPQSAGQTQGKNSAPIVHFTDAAAKAGLTAPVVFGGETTKKYIIETTGTGVAIFDYDNDGWPDIFIVNGTKLQGFARDKEPTSHLYHNNHDGTFTEVTQKAGLTLTGWGQGVCVGDYDNDGFEDLYITYYGKNVLYHNNGNGTFTEVSEKAGVAGNGKNWGTGCAFVDYDRDGKLDLMVANYVNDKAAT